MGVLSLSLFWYALFCALPSFAIILKRKRELVALLSLAYGYLVTVKVQWLFLIMQWVGLEFMIVVFPDHTHQLLILVTKMPPCSNKVKHLLNILWDQKTKMPSIPYMELTFKFFWSTWYAHSKGGRRMLPYFFRSWIGFRAVFSSTRVFVKGRKCRLTSVTEKTDVVYCLLHSRL